MKLYYSVRQKSGLRGRIHDFKRRDVRIPELQSISFKMEMSKKDMIRQKVKFLLF